MALRVNVSVATADDGLSATIQTATAGAQELASAISNAAKAMEGLAAMARQAQGSIASGIASGPRASTGARASAGGGFSAGAARSAAGSAAANNNDMARGGNSAANDMAKGAEEAAKRVDALTRAFGELAAKMTGNDLFADVVSSAFDVADAFGGVSKIMGRIPASAGLAAGAFAVVGVAAVAAYQAWAGYRESIMAVDRANTMSAVSIGMTRAALEQQAATAADQANISIQAARAQQATYIATGKIGGDMMGRLIGISRQYADATKQDVASVDGDLARIFADPVKGAEELSTKYGLLSASQLDNIRTLSAMGEETKAADALMAALSTRLDETSGRLTALGSAMVTVGNFFSGLSDSIGKGINGLFMTSSDGTEEYQAQVDRAKAFIAQYKGLVEGGKLGGVGGFGIRLQYTQALKELAEGEAALAKAAKDAADKRTKDLARQDGVDADNLTRQLDPTIDRRTTLDGQRIKLQNALDSGADLPHREQTVEQLDQIKAALASLKDAKEKAVAMDEAEAKAATMGAVARAGYLAEVRTELELSGQVMPVEERNRRIKEAGKAATDQARAALEGSTKATQDNAKALADKATQEELAIAASQRLAEAAGKGEAAQRAAAYANEIAAAKARSDTEETKAREATKLREATTVKQITNEAIGDLQGKTEANERMTAALKRGGAAIADNAREEYRLTMQRKLGIEAVEELNTVMAEYDRWQASESAKAEAGPEGERLTGLREELKLLQERNKQLADQGRGGAAGAAAGVVAARLEIQTQIDDKVEQRHRELLALADKVKGVYVETETLKYRIALEDQARLEEQRKIQEQAGRAASSMSNIIQNLDTGNIQGIADGVSQFMGEFRQLTDLTGSATEAFSQMGEKLLDSAEAGNALGNIVGDLLGRSEQQNKNAKIGSTVATTVGDMFGVPKGISSFVGNIVGGLFGPGKSDSTAAAEIWTSTGRTKITDVAKSKQSSENMSARDQLASSILTFSEMLREATGGSVVDKVDVHVGSRDGNTWFTGTEQGRTAVGDIEGTLSQVLAAITRTLTGVPDELKDRLQSIDFSDLERAQSDVSFVLGYDTAIGKLNGTLEGGSDAVATAKKNVVDMRNYVTDFAAQAGRLGYDVGETADALRNYVERFAGIRDAAPPMTELETKVAALRASFTALAPVLEAVGYSATDAAAAVTSAQAKQIGALKTDFEAGLTRENRDLTGRGYLNTIDDLTSQRDQRYRDADAVGSARGIVDDNFTAGLDNAFASLDLKAIQDIQTQFAAGTPVYEAAARAADKLNGSVAAVGETAEQAAARIAATANLSATLADRMARANGSADTQDGALAIFDRAAQQEKAATQARIAAGELAASVMTELETTLGAERAAVISRFSDAAVNAEQQRQERLLQFTQSVSDRQFALDHAKDADLEIKQLERRQNAEFAAAAAAGYTNEQLEKLRLVLAGEMTDAVNTLNEATRQTAARALEAAKAVNDNVADRYFAATNDNSTLEGALAAFDRQAAKDRIETAQTAGADMLALERTLAAERQAIINRFAQQAIDAEQQRLAALSQAGGQLRAWIDGIRAGNGTPQANLETIRSQYQQQLALANGGNIEAVQGLREYAQRLIDAESNRTASGADRRAMVETILGQLEAVPAVKSYDQQVLEALQALGGGVSVEVGLSVIRTITEVLSALPAEERDRLIQAQTIVRAIEERLGRSLTAGELDLLVESGTVSHIVQQMLGRDLTSVERAALLASSDITRTVQQMLGRDLTSVERAALIGAGDFIRTVQQMLGRDLTAAERASLIVADSVERRVEQLLGRQLTGAEAATLIQPGSVERLIAQQVGATTGSPLVPPETVTRTINQVLTMQGQILSSQTLSQQIAIELGDVQFQGQAQANRYLAAIAWNTARMVGAAGDGILIVDDPAQAGDQTLREQRAAATLNTAGASAFPTSVANDIGTIKDILESWKPVISPGGMIDKIRHNTAEAARLAGGYASYAVGTDFHPGGWAMVGEQGPEKVYLPRGAQVFTRDQTLELARRPRAVVMGVASAGGGDNRALTATIERQVRATERQNALLEKIAANSAAGADAAAETAKALKTPARVRVGTVAKLAGGRQ